MIIKVEILEDKNIKNVDYYETYHEKYVLQIVNYFESLNNLQINENKNILKILKQITDITDHGVVINHMCKYKYDNDYILVEVHGIDRGGFEEYVCNVVKLYFLDDDVNDENEKYEEELSESNKNKNDELFKPFFQSISNQNVNNEIA